VSGYPERGKEKKKKSEVEIWPFLNASKEKVGGDFVVFLISLSG